MPESSLPLSWLKRGLIASACAFACLVPATAAQAAPAATTEVYRLYNTETADHVWTTSLTEYETVAGQGSWVGEGLKWIAPTQSSRPVYRLYNTSNGLHHFTADSNERSVLLNSPEWVEETSGIYSAEADGGKPLYRLYHPESGSHLLTTEENEKNELSTNFGWTVETVSVYAAALPEEVADPEPNAPEEPIAPGEPEMPDDIIDANDPLAATRASVVAYAREFVGWPYVYAGESPEEGGFDCSGLVQYVYKHFGVDLPRTTYALESYLKERGTWTTDIEQMKLGDVIVMNDSGHVGIFAGKDPETGRYMMVDAGNSSTGVVYREIMYYYHPEWSGPLQGGGSVL